MMAVLLAPHFADVDFARLAKALDKLETILQHTQGENPVDFDYAFNFSYGREHTEGSALIAALRAALDEATRARSSKEFRRDSTI